MTSAVTFVLEKNVWDKMGDSAQPSVINEEAAVDFDLKADSRRYIQSLPRDFREHDELTNNLQVSAKFFSVPRRLPADVELEAPKRKGGLPRILDFLTRRTSKELRYFKQENDSTEGSAESPQAPPVTLIPSSRPSSILLRPWLATEEEAASLTGLSKSPLLSSPETTITETVSLSPSLQDILQIIQKSSVFVSNTKPSWINEENIMVIAHIDYRGTAEDHLSFKVGQRIFQTKGADDNGFAFGTMKKHRFGHQEKGYYPAIYVIPQPVKPQLQIVRICRRISQLLARAEETKDPAEDELQDERRAYLPVIRKSSKSCVRSVYPVMDDLGPISSMKL